MENNQNVDLIRKMMSLVESTNQKITSSIISEQITPEMGEEEIETTPQEGEVDEQVTQSAKAGAEMLGDILSSEKGLFKELQKEMPQFFGKFQSVDKAIEALKSGQMSTMDAFKMVKQARNIPEIAAKIKGLVSDTKSFQSIAQKVYPKGTLMPPNPKNLETAITTLEKTYGMSAAEAEAALKQAAQKVGGTGGVTAKAIDGALARRAKELKGSSPEVSKFVQQDVVNPIKQVEQGSMIIKKIDGPSAEWLRRMAERMKKYKPDVFEKLKKLKGRLNIKQIALYGLAGVGLYELLKGAFSSGEGDQTNTILPDCIVNTPGVQFTTGNGDVAVAYVKQDLDVQSKGHGGYYFFPNSRVFTKDMAMKGSYSCAGPKVQATIAEQVGPDPADFASQNSNIKIVWDKEGEKPTPTPIPKKPKYHACPEDGTFTIGCKSHKIQEIQVCLGMEQKYQTGNYGPLTKAKLQEKGYDVTMGITQEMYAKIMAECNKQQGVDQTGTTPEPRVKLKDADYIKTDRKPGFDTSALQDKLKNIQMPNIQQAPQTPLTPEREEQLKQMVTDRGFDQVVKMKSNLTSQEQNFLNKYLYDKFGKTLDDNDKIRKRSDQTKYRLPNT